MLWILFSCSTTPSEPAEPAESPAAPLAAEPTDPLAEWQRTLGLMARSDEDACAGIRQAWALEVQARDDESLRTRLAKRPGFRTIDDQVVVHWVELARATKASSAETAMVTVGGIAARLRDDCLDASSLVHWLRRSPVFTKTQPCTREALGEVVEAISTPALERTCVCNPPEPQAIEGLLKAVDELAMDPAPWKAWAESWKTCEPSATPEP